MKIPEAGDTCGCVSSTTHHQLPSSKGSSDRIFLSEAEFVGYSLNSQVRENLDCNCADFSKLQSPKIDTDHTETMNTNPSLGVHQTGVTPEKCCQRWGDSASFRFSGELRPTSRTQQHQAVLEGYARTLAQFFGFQRPRPPLQPTAVFQEKK